MHRDRNATFYDQPTDVMVYPEYADFRYSDVFHYDSSQYANVKLYRADRNVDTGNISHTEIPLFDCSLK